MKTEKKNLNRKKIKPNPEDSISDSDVKIELDKFKGELDELIDDDGGLLGSKIPLYNMTLHPRKTMSQTIVTARFSNDPVVRGYRVYYGESEEKDDNVVSEMDFSDAFGYEETKDLDYNGTIKTLKKMGIEDPFERDERAQAFGKLRGKKVKKTKSGKKVLKQRLVEKDSLEEEQKKRMIKMVEDILAKKSKKDNDVIEKETSVSKILTKNLQSIKKLAEKEGISINQLIKVLKTGEQ
jgi:hypothetical protein